MSIVYNASIMSTTIKCTKCGEEIEISQALLHQVEEQVKVRLRAEIEKSAREKAVADVSVQMKDRENQVTELREQNKALTGQLLELNKSIRDLKDQDEKRALEYEKRLNEAIDRTRELAKTIGGKIPDGSVGTKTAGRYEKVAG